MVWNYVVLGGVLLGQTSGAPARTNNPASRWEAPAPGTAGPAAPAEKTAPLPATGLPADAASPRSLPAEKEPAGAGRAHASRSQALPLELLAEALAPRAGTPLGGRPLTLSAALSSTADRRQQLEAIHAYWRLAEAVADYHYGLDHERLLDQLSARAEGAWLLRTAQSSSKAARGEAEVAALVAQHELAAAALLPANTPLPLPADRPHVGAYRTNFTELSAIRAVPPRARLLDQTLPFLRQALEVRATAIEAAQDAQTAAVEAYQAGRGDLTTLLLCAAELHRQRKAFVQSVRQYNDQIADYALNVTGLNLSGPALVGMLIEAPRENVRPLAFEDDGTGAGQPGPRTAPTTAPSPPTAPAPAPAPSVLREPAPAPPGDKGPPLPPPGDTGLPPVAPSNEAPSLLPPEPLPSRPNRVPPPSLDVPPASRLDPAAAPPRLEPGPGPAAAAPGASPAAPASEAGSVPGGLPPSLMRDAPDQALPAGATEPAPDPLPLEPAAPAPRTTNRPLEHAHGGSLPAPYALYPGLIEARPLLKARELALALNWDRTLPEGSGTPTTLEECLRGRSAADRRQVIETYWSVRQRAAEYQVLAQQIELVQNLSALGSRHAGRAGRHAAAARLRTLQLATEAALLEARAALLAGEFELAGRIGREGGPSWPLPSTSPHAGPYALKLDSQSPELRQSRPIQRLAATIPMLYATLEERAVAVVEADTARAALTALYEAQAAPLDDALDAAARQTEETLAFLHALTEYNRALGQYALAVMPPTIPSDQLVATLVTKAQPAKDARK